MDKLAYVFLFIYLYSPGLTSDAAHGGLQMFTSINAPTKEITDGKLEVAFRECGFILCNVSDIFTNKTTHYWDYYVDWELPPGAQDMQDIFVLANRFQLPRAYLVFAGFTSDFVGEYKCVLNFRREPISSLSLNISMSGGAASRDCSNSST